MDAGIHIYVYKSGYTHHGIYIGNENVIHYSGFANGFESGSIELTDLESFSDGEHVFIEKYLFKKYSNSEVIERAYSRLGEDSYNLLFNNCEHFAKWCVTGEHESSQVQNILHMSPLLMKSTGVKVLTEGLTKASAPKDSDFVKDIAVTTVTSVLIPATIPALIARNILKKLF